MPVPLSTQIAGILGPVIMAVTSSEYFNYKIWDKVAPNVVYLNGMVLFIGGLLVVRLHNFWLAEWAVVVTIAGWLLLLAGLYRMFFPASKQAPPGMATNVFIGILFLTGCFLTYKAYF